MAPRLDLHALLKTITPNVYFQPPPNTTLKYPCIIYNRSDIRTEHANNRPYSQMKRYEVTVMDRDPDSSLPDQVGALPSCVFDRHYTAKDLHHDVYRLFF